MKAIIEFLRQFDKDDPAFGAMKLLCLAGMFGFVVMFFGVIVWTWRVAIWGFQ